MSSINSIYFIFFTTGITVGFGHCIGMCGPIVISLSLQLKGRPSLWPQLLYNTGRTCTYTVLGAIAGGTGSFSRFAQSIDGLQTFVMVAAGLMIVVMGLAMSGWVKAGTLFHSMPSLNAFLTAGFKRLLPRARNPVVYFPLGLLLGLLPCGPVYTAMLAAARTGMESAGTLAGAASGAGLMLSFGLGTVPALYLVSKLSDLGWLKHRDSIYRFGALLMIAVGGYFVWKGLMY